MAEMLKPCPFCGGEAAIQRFGNQGLPFRIICSCGAEIRGGKGESVADGVERWNSRAERTCHVERVSTPYHGGPPRCSACMMPLEPLVNYCPYCGARVVSK